MTEPPGFHVANVHAVEAGYRQDRLHDALGILLSGFTDDYSALLIGVNLGGLGTLIASLASLISFKFYTHSNGSDTRRFLGIFTLYNVIFLGVLFVLSLILC